MFLKMLQKNKFFKKKQPLPFNLAFLILLFSEITSKLILGKSENN
jgi:hypothetical protein